MKAIVKKSEGNKLIAIIGDEVVLFLLRILSLAFSSQASEKGTSKGKLTTSLLTKVVFI